jgi:hypothetical protein
MRFDWNYKYHSPFSSTQQFRIPECLGDLLPKYAGHFWAIPDDNRISLATSPQGLGLNLTENAGPDAGLSYFEKVLQEIASFNSQLLRSSTRDFFVVDYDPWAKAYLSFQFGETNKLHIFAGGVLFPTEWELDWKNQDPPVLLVLAYLVQMKS